MKGEEEEEEEEEWGGEAGGEKGNEVGGEHTCMSKGEMVETGKGETIHSRN